MESTICHFDIPCDDLEGAREFYSRLFGWTVVPMPQMADGYLLLQTAEDPASLGGGLCQRTGDNQHLRLYVTVTDIDASADKLVKLGGEVAVGKTPLPSVGWVVTGTDPQGNPIGLFQEDKEAG